MARGGYKAPTFSRIEGFSSLTAAEKQRVRDAFRQMRKYGFTIPDYSQLKISGDISTVGKTMESLVKLNDNITRNIKVNSKRSIEVSGEIGLREARARAAWERQKSTLKRHGYEVPEKYQVPATVLMSGRKDQVEAALKTNAERMEKISGAGRGESYLDRKDRLARENMLKSVSKILQTNDDSTSGENNILYKIIEKKLKKMSKKQLQKKLAEADDLDMEVLYGSGEEDKGGDVAQSYLPDAMKQLFGINGKDNFYVSKNGTVLSQKEMEQRLKSKGVTEDPNYTKYSINELISELGGF